MFKKLTIASQFKWIFLGAFLTLGVGIESKPAIAGCNFHGCSQSSVAECNFHGCPNPPMGAECNFHGCPPSPQPPQQQQQQQQQQPVQQVPVVYPAYPYPPYPNVGGSPQGIQQCMNSLYIQTRTSLYSCLWMQWHTKRRYWWLGISQRQNSN